MRTTKGHEEKCKGDGKIFHLDYSGGCRVYTLIKTQNCKVKMGTLCYIHIIPQLNLFKQKKVDHNGGEI